MIDDVSVSKSDGSTGNGYTMTVMLFVGEYGKASTRWLPVALGRLLDTPMAVLDLTEARITDSGVIDELMWLHEVRAGRSLPRERIVMTNAQASQPELGALHETFDVAPDLPTAVEGTAGFAVLDYAREPYSGALDRLPTILTLAAEEWDIESADALASLLAPAADHRDVIVDLSAVSYIDSTCLGKFVGMRAKRGARGFEPAKLVIASPRIRRLFAIVKFDEIWPIYATLHEALRADTGESAIAPAS